MIAAAALQAPRPNYFGVVMPYKPPVDKVAALVILQRYNKSQVDDVQYWKRNECSPEQFAHWEKLHIYPIDIGERKYHNARINGQAVGSATDYIAKAFELPLSAGEQKVLAMINENNGTGSLKRAPFSMPQLLRLLYEASDDPERHLEVISRATDIINCYIDVEDGQSQRDEAGLATAFPYETGLLKNAEPLTLGRYLRDLWKLSSDEKAIKEKITFWLKSWYEIKGLMDAAEAEFAAMQNRDEFTIVKMSGLTLRTDDRFLVGAAINSRLHDLCIFVTSGGHTAIRTKRLDCSALAQALAREEPGRWYYQDSTGSLINGGPQYVEVEPTSLSPEQLRQRIGQFPPARRPKKK